MDLNTSPFTPVEWLSKLSRQVVKLSVNLYPDTTYMSLREAISGYVGCNPDMVTVGNGADECLMMISQAFIDRGSKAVVSYPSYSYFRVCTEIMGGKIINIKRKPSFEDDFDALASAADKDTRIIFLCSPNNPTGNLVEPQGLRKLLDETRSTIVVDEAYHEYCGKSFADLVSSYPNLIIVRTFSKAFSLAGVRVGYIVAAEETIDKINKVRPPNSVGTISQRLASIGLRNVGLMRKWVTEVVKERERVKNSLKKIEGVEAYESHANFLLIRFRFVDAEKIHQKLLEKGIVVRNLSGVVDNSLRVTILRRRENNRFLRSLEKILKELLDGR